MCERVSAAVYGGVRSIECLVGFVWICDSGSFWISFSIGALEEPCCGKICGVV